MLINPLSSFCLSVFHFHGPASERRLDCTHTRGVQRHHKHVVQLSRAFFSCPVAYRFLVQLIDLLPEHHVLGDISKRLLLLHPLADEEENGLVLLALSLDIDLLLPSGAVFRLLLQLEYIREAQNCAVGHDIEALAIEFTAQKLLIQRGKRLVFIHILEHVNVHGFECLLML